MHSRTMLFVAMLGAALAGTATGQQAASTAPTKSPTGLSFAYDAAHGQLTPSGYAVRMTPRPAASAKVTGTVDVTFTVSLVSKFPKETSFPCSATLLGGEVDINTLTLDGGVTTVNGRATVASSNGASTATCSLSIPYSFTVAADPSASGGLLVAVAMAAAREDWVQSTTLQVGGFQPFPASGSPATYSFDGAL